MGKVILYGAGRQGVLALHKYGKGRVAFFCDGFTEADEIEGIKVIRPDELPKVLDDDKDLTVVLTPKLQLIRDEIQASLDEKKIPYLIFEKTDGRTYGNKCFQIAGSFPDIEYVINEDDINDSRWRIGPTIEMFKAMFEKYADDFSGRNIDMTIFSGDIVLDAYSLLPQLGKKRVFAYSTIYALKDKVIPIPDYRCCFDEDKYRFEESPQKCAEAAKEKWTDKRIGWRGTIASSDERRWLQIIADDNPDKLFVGDYSYDNRDKYVPMTDLAKYKYTLDIRGYGWTDRVKVLMQLGRPMFLVDRPFREWYFDKLIPMEHFVPVKEDMSDLIEKYDHLESHPDVYDHIVKCASEFVKENFSPDAVLGALKDIVLKYGAA